MKLSKLAKSMAKKMKKTKLSKTISPTNLEESSSWQTLSPTLSPIKFDSDPFADLRSPSPPAAQAKPDSRSPSPPPLVVVVDAVGDVEMEAMEVSSISDDEWGSRDDETDDEEYSERAGARDSAYWKSLQVPSEMESQVPSNSMYNLEDSYLPEPKFEPAALRPPSPQVENPPIHHYDVDVPEDFEDWKDSGFHVINEGIPVVVKPAE